MLTPTGSTDQTEDDRKEKGDVNKTTHKGCRVCGRTDVTMKKNQTLRRHAHAAHKGSSLLQPGHCPGSNHPPKGIVGAYAADVLDILRPHFPDLNQKITAEVIGEAIQNYLAAPYDHFECLLTGNGTWRLRGHRDLPGRVRVACWQVDPSDAAKERVRRLNGLLESLRAV